MSRLSNPLRVAVVGIGSAATRAHLPALAALQANGTVTLVGVCDRRAERRDPVVAAQPTARGFEDCERMLDAVSPDLLVIATPPSAHLDEIGAAAGRGIHVLCEKPLGLSGADVARLRRLCAEHPDLALATVQQYGHAPPWRWLARALRGALEAGEPFWLTATVERPGTDPLSAGGWRADPEREGGIIGDHGAHYLGLVHALDPAARVVGCDRRGRGGSEEAAIEVSLGTAGRACLELSYAGQHRRNRLRVQRPRQCLDIVWEDDRVTFDHNGTARVHHAVASLSERRVVNELYSPLYSEVLAGLTDRAWRERTVAATLGVATLLAGALEMAAAGRVADPSPV